jgi:Holliday junction resolvasome RuvABC DNA-binding subunit
VAAGAGPRAELRDALAGLGYAPDEVRDVLARLDGEGTLEEMLRDALRMLAGAR